MTDKKGRQRGSRTHGGGSHKNRRGAGHRGGRGAAGRDKHEFHNHEPLGKSGFSRPSKLQKSVSVVNLRKIDEYALYNDVSRIDARRFVEDEDADIVKVLGSGRFDHEIKVFADEFSASAIEKIRSAGGEIELADQESELKNPEGNNESMRNNNNEVGEQGLEVFDQEDGLPSPEDINDALSTGIETESFGEVYDSVVDAAEDADRITPDHIIEFYRLRYAAEDLGMETSEIDSVIDRYFEDHLSGDRAEELQQGVPDSMTPEDVEAGLRELENEWQSRLGEDYSPLDSGLEDAKNKYLLSVRSAMG